MMVSAGKFIDDITSSPLKIIPLLNKPDVEMTDGTSIVFAQAEALLSQELNMAQKELIRSIQFWRA